MASADDDVLHDAPDVNRAERELGVDIDGDGDIGEGTTAVVESLLAEDARLAYGTEDGRQNLEPGTALKSIVDHVFEVHGRRIPNLGAR